MTGRPATWGVELGVYEKAFLWTGAWDALFEQAANAGFAFIDLSVDETEDRVSRLWWSEATRAEVHEASLRHGVAIGSLCLSAHRKVAPGSVDPATRRKALELLLRSVDLSVDLGAPLIQIAGYYAFYEARAAGARERYLEVIAAGAAYAAQRGVMLGLDNVDGTDITSITRALDVCDEIGSAHLQLYPDIGNLTERGLDVVAELAAGSGRMLALHVKDTRPGEPRRVPMGAGDVPWAEAFSELARQGWSGRMLIEMWNDSRPDAATEAKRAQAFIHDRLEAAGIPLSERASRPVA